MKVRALSSLVLAALAVGASAQTTNDKIGIRLGYGFSADYGKRNGDTARIEGPELALQIPIGEMRGMPIYFEPSFFGGGRLRTGGDSDGDVYRATVYVRRGFGGATYIQLGGGFAHFVDRANQADAESGVVGQIGVGLPLGGFAHRYSPSFEVNFFASSQPQLRGLFFGVVGHV